MQDAHDLQGKHGKHAGHEIEEKAADERQQEWHPKVMCAQTPERKVHLIHLDAIALSCEHKHTCQVCDLVEKAAGALQLQLDRGTVRIDLLHSGMFDGIACKREEVGCLDGTCESLNGEVKRVRLKAP